MTKILCALGWAERCPTSAPQRWTNETCPPWR